MNPSLTEAAKTGDVKFLRRAVSGEKTKYFLNKAPMEEDGALGGNIFHLAAWNDQEDFFSEAIKLLPTNVVKRLLVQTDDDYRYTPLHAAAEYTPSNHSIVKLIKQFYDSITEDPHPMGKPWMALAFNNMTPLHMALKDNKENEACAMLILSMDDSQLSSSCSLYDDDGNSPLYYALKNGFNLMSHHILTSSLPSPSFFDENVLMLFQLAPKFSENVVRLLFENCGQYMDKTDERGYTVLHDWASEGAAGPCQLLLDSDGFAELKTKIFKELVYAAESRWSNTPMHLAAMERNSELALVLIRGYQQQVEVRNQVSVASTLASVSASATVVPPWNIKNTGGNTPLHSALFPNSSHEVFALEVLAIDPTLCLIRNDRGESPFFLAVSSGLTRVVDEILRVQEPVFDLLRRYDGTTVLHNLSSCPGIRLLEKYWWMISFKDDSGKTALDKAKESKKPWLVNLLMNPSLIQKERFDWVTACQREETEAILAFINHCDDLQKACREENDTPLHHIKLTTYQEYRNLLQIPSIRELKNTTDQDGATPLHRALERKDMLLVKILLLDDGVERTTEDRNSTTPMDLLVQLCQENDDWERMCKQININPHLQTSYIQQWTNLDQIRSTLSIVAALLATITFAAGFTLPGGLNDKTGEAILATKPAFLVFLLADVIAMCTAMLVLFYLVWSMVSKPDMARLLVDQSVYILMISLYSTLLAFMTGIYTMIAKRSLWAAILIFAMCSIIGISTNRTVLDRMIAKFIPTTSNTNTDTQDRIRLLEQGRAGASLARNNTSRNGQ
ncbi:hypothetical protein RND81_09G034800 [Saponaria officinalis]|uniref:PGG domain-containing protein n=1 Tax=Saponaria officinalis TaxID=3572 RepID=A0AAW1II83_SAPOF